MSERIGRDDLTRMLRTAAERVKANAIELSRLDSVCGDGDHGASMDRAMDRMLQALSDHPEARAGELLLSIGWGILDVDAGPVGPLLGSFFLAMNEGLREEPLDVPALARAFEEGLAGVGRNTRARPGDRTVLDALVPAVQRFRVAADAGATLAQALDQAATAAEEGARRTAGREARFGRARHRQEKGAGQPDPGATSFALLFRGFADGAALD